MKLSSDEKNNIRLFFEESNDWIISHSLQNLDNMREFINMYGEFIVRNNLAYSRHLMLFLVELKEEELRIRCTSSYKSHPVYKEVPSIDNAVVNKWKAMSREIQIKMTDVDTIDYDELSRKIYAQQEKQNQQKSKQKTIKREIKIQ